MTTIALYNLKGGVGKTASSVNIAYLAAKDGYNTLLWDIDPQGSSSFYFNGKYKYKGGIKKMLSDGADLAEGITQTDYENLDLISADQSPKSMDVLMEEMKSSKKKLKNVLHPLPTFFRFLLSFLPINHYNTEPHNCYGQTFLSGPGTHPFFQHQISKECNWKKIFCL